MEGERARCDEGVMGRLSTGRKTFTSKPVY